jgi:hypothetical protein
MPVDLLQNINKNIQSAQPKDLLAPQNKPPIDLLSTPPRPNAISIGVIPEERFEQKFAQVRQKNPILWKLIDVIVPGLKPALKTKELKLPEEQATKQILEPTFDEFIKGVNVPVQLVHKIPFDPISLVTAEWAPEYLGKKEVQEFFKPKTVVADITGRVASLFGMWKGIGILRKTMPWMSMTGWKPTSQIAGLARHILRGGLTLGAYNLLTEHGGRSLKDNLKQRGQSGAIGFGIGAVFESVGLLSGELVKDTTGRFFRLAVKDTTAQKMAFIMRLGANQYFTGIPAFKRFIRGEEHLPGLIFEVGLGTMFSLSENPLKTETEYNKYIKDRYKLKGSTIEQLIPIIEKAGTVNNVPTDIKWAYIIKATGVKPSYQNAGDMLENEMIRFRDPIEYNKRLTSGQIKSNIGSTDYIFEQALKINNPTTHGKLSFTQSVMTDIEKEMITQAKVPITEITTTTAPAKPGIIPPEIKPVTPAPIVSASEVPKGTMQMFHFSENVHIKKFTTEKVEGDLGVHFGTEQAAKERQGKRKGKIYPVQIEPANPLVGKEIVGRKGLAVPWEDPRSVLDMINNTGAISKHEHLSMRSKIPSINDIKYKNRNGTFNPDKFYAARTEWFGVMRQLLIGKGYDSVLYMNEGEAKGTWSIVPLKDDIIKTVGGRVEKPVDILKQPTAPPVVGPPILPITPQVTEITSKIKVGGKDITTGHAQVDGPILRVGILEMQPGFRDKGIDSRVIRNLINEGLKVNKGLVGAEGFVNTEAAFVNTTSFGAKYYDAGKNLLTFEQAVERVKTGGEVNYKIDFRSTDFISSKAGQEMPYLSWIPRELVKQEDNLRSELATDKDINKLRKTARAVGLLYKSKDNKEVRNRLNTFLMDYYNVKYDQLNTLTVAQVEEARKMMQQLVPGPSGKIKLPKTTEILPIDLIEEFRRKGNLFDWLQSGRIAVRPIYDLFKPAYQNMLLSREAKLDALREIYKNRVKRGSEIDQKLALYSDGKINLDDIPEAYRDIAVGRQDFYDKYADILVEQKLLAKDKVYNKDGTRKQYYHRIFDDAITQIYREGYAIDDFWLPGQLPLAGPLRKRLGSTKYKLSAVESDIKYVYAMEKYLNLKDANNASIKYARQYSGIRRSMADTYIRYMRGQPTKFDKQLREAIQNVSNGTADLLERAGIKDQATKLRQWSAPTYPMSRLTSPIARFYYWRYIGFAMDTAFKNSIQWEHAAARYGWDNVTRAFYEQFTPEGKKLIEESGILREGIQRSRHFVEESAVTQKFNKIEQAGYWVWEGFETQNRNVSGLAGYYDAMAQGKTHQQGLEAMRTASHETQYGYCVTPDTECLTPVGWKKYNELRIGDNIFTLNMSTNKLEQQPIKEIGIFDYNGNMIHLYNQSLNKIMTPNHRCVVRDRKDKNKIILASDLKHSHRIARIAEYDCAEIISDNIIKLIGWTITEGYLAKFRKGTRTNIRIYQSLKKNPQKCVEIQNLLNTFGDCYNMTLSKRGCITYSLHKDLSCKLLEYIPDIRLSMSFILKLSKRQMEILLQTMVDGDGWRGDKGGLFFTQCLRKKQNINNLQILAYLCGYTCTIYKEKTDESGIYYIAYMSKRTKNTEVGRCKKEIIKYTGKIWCPIVENGTWIAKRGGKIFITGNTKADSLLMDMSNPMWRFVLFKKWPLAKVEMIRGWIKENRRDAVLNLAMQEYMMYRGAQAVGIDLGGQFGSIWQLATRGLSTPADMIPLVGDITNIVQAFGTGPTADKAKEKLINAWQGLGNRWIGKGINVWRAWLDDWNVREHGGQLRYQSTPKEQLITLFTSSQEATERRAQMTRMQRVKNDVSAYQERAIRQVLAGDTEGAGKTMQEMLDKYSDEFAEYYGKKLEPINLDDVRRFLITQETPIIEKVRKGMPGKGPKIPVGYKFEKRPPKDLIGAIRGY